MTLITSISGIRGTIGGAPSQNLTPVDIVKFLSEHMTLEPGDLIYTGTPEGVSKVERGDVLKASITNIAEIENKII